MKKGVPAFKKQMLDLRRSADTHLERCCSCHKIVEPSSPKRKNVRLSNSAVLCGLCAQIRRVS